MAEQADVLEIGSLLLYKYGEQAVIKFREQFPNATILADTKIVDRGKEAVELFAQAGADWVTVMAGTSRSVIHSVSTTAHELGKKVMLDLIDASSLGQSALEAKSLALMLFFFINPQMMMLNLLFLIDGTWSKATRIFPSLYQHQLTRENIHEVLTISPAGIVIGKSIIHAENPAEEAAYFKSVMS